MTSAEDQSDNHYKDQLAAGRYKEAEASLDTLLQSTHRPRSSTALAVLYNDLGYCRYMQVNFWPAVAAYEAALGEDASLAAAHYNRATVLYRMGMFAEAETGFGRAVELDGSNVEFLEGLSACRKVLLPQSET
jgi:tetratricopeptide (TPR) repeat protein